MAWPDDAAYEGALLMIDDVALARIMHILFVVHWIGGVGFVTLIVLPKAQSSADPAKGWALFQAMERRFSQQVRFTVPLAGLAGFWLTYRMQLWPRFADWSFWWMDAMVAVWLVFMALIFIVEPAGHRAIEAAAAKNPAATAARIAHGHLVLLAAAAITIAGAVAGAHGGFWR